MSLVDAMNNKPKTIEEWDALPEYQMFECERIDLLDDRFPDAVGLFLEIPRMNKNGPLAHHIEKTDPLYWMGADGDLYEPVLTQNGWMKQHNGNLQYILSLRSDA